MVMKFVIFKKCFCKNMIHDFLLSFIFLLLLHFIFQTLPLLLFYALVLTFIRLNNYTISLSAQIQYNYTICLRSICSNYSSLFLLTLVIRAKFSLFIAKYKYGTFNKLVLLSLMYYLY